PPVVLSPNVWCHLEIQLANEFGEIWRRMAEQGIMLVLYDMRGMGMSDRDAASFSLENQLADIEAVRERVGLDRFALYGNVQGCPAAIGYAANHPQRVSHLILSVPFPNGDEWYRASPTLQGLESFRALGDEQWELYTITHATALLGMRGQRPENIQRLAALMRECTTPGTLRRYFTEFLRLDLRPVFGKIRAPTLVLSTPSGRPAGVGRASAKFARQVAAGIVCAQLATLDTSFQAPALPAARLALEFILGRPVDWPCRSRADAQQSPPVAGTAIILFADIADPTALTARLA